MKNPPKIRRNWFFAPLFALVLCLPMMRSAQAATYTISVGELAALFDPQRPRNGALFDQYMVKLLQQELDAQGLRFQAGQLFYSAPMPYTEKNFDGIKDCPPRSSFVVAVPPIPYRFRLDSGFVDLTFNQNSSFTLTLNELKSATVKMTARGKAITQNASHTSSYVSAAVLYGYSRRTLRSGPCRERYTDKGRIKAEADFFADLSLQLNLNPVYDPVQKALIINKSANVSGVVNLHNKNVNADFGPTSVAGGLLRAFELAVVYYGEERGIDLLNVKLADINCKFTGSPGVYSENNTACKAPDGTVTPFNVPTVIKLPAGLDMIQLANQIIKEFDLPEVIADYVKQRPDEVLLALLASDANKRAELLAELGSNLSCDALRRRFDRPLPLTTAYQFNFIGAACSAANQEGPEVSRYFADAACATQLAFRPTPAAQFCSERISPASKTILGNAASWTPDVGQVNDPLPSVPSRKWTALPSTRLDMGAISNGGHAQPVTKLLKYKTVTGVGRGNGTCELEMRVFTADTKRTDLKPILAIHGGTWNARGFSATGLEATVNHFTHRGFVVFAPFYRLTGQNDGNVECNGASWREVTQDVTDALAWVKQYGAAFGARPGRISVFGQSAGAHLAGYLSTHRPLDVEKALMMYPPLDTLEFLQGASPVSNRYPVHAAFGFKVLAGLFGSSRGLTEVDLRQVDLAGIDFKRPPGSLVDRIPDSVFNLTSVNPAEPPAYLRRCAAAANVNLAGISLASPPPAIMQCLKREMSDFILENSFTHQVNANTPPLYVVMGSGDELIPYQNTVVFCETLNAAPIAVDPNAVAGAFACGIHGKLTLLKGANHMLDLGLCVGPVCPAGPVGSPLRSAVATALSGAYDWMALPDPSNRTGAGGGPAPSMLWSNDLSVGTDGLSPLPAGYMQLAGGRLAVITQNVATEDWPWIWGTREYTLRDRVTFRAEVTTGPQMNGRDLMVGAEGNWNVAAFRRHAAYFYNGSVYISFYDGGFQTIPMGPIANNTTYVVEVVTAATGTTLYVYEKGGNRANSYSDTRPYADWGVVTLFVESHGYPGAVPVTTYVDNLSEFVQ